ncbi:MAG: Rap1a/Tai family immunity protein [Woeseiaceae bacterium]|jgi:hypothetical protein|nr:Rap1a/Tai family immunity protein [Woeseiaceae bacterium]
MQRLFRTRLHQWCCVGVLIATSIIASTTASRAAFDPDDFVIDSAADLVDLCSAAPDHELYVPAIHMCHGFVSGVAQYALLLFGESGGAFFCLPDPAPTRNAAIEDFIGWMSENSQLSSAPAPEALVRFMTVRFPCE